MSTKLVAIQIVKFRGKKNILLNSYLLYWIMGNYCQAKLETLATGSTALGIKSSKLGEIECLVPPLTEQSKIVSFIESQAAKIDALIEKAKRSIELAKEHRTALISAAVTGKIDLREVN